MSLSPLPSSDPFAPPKGDPFAVGIDPGQPQPPVRQVFLLFVAASMVWVAAWYLAFMSQRPFLTPLALALPFVGPVVLGVGLNAWRQRMRRTRARSKRTTVNVMILVAALAPLFLRSLPGFSLNEPSPIPGRPWLVALASPYGVADLYLIKGAADVRDGSGLVQLTSTPESEGGGDVSPDRSQLVYSSLNAGTFDLWIVGLDANGIPVGAPRRVTTNEPGHELVPRWSPDGRWIAFQVDLGDHDDVAIVRSDGEKLQQLTHNGDSHDAQWSPDGSQITFSRPTQSEPEDLAIWAMGADGSDPHVVADTAGDDYGPVFITPTVLAFTSDPGDEEDVWIVELPDREQWNLTDDPNADDFSVSSSSGGQVLYASDRAHAGGSFLYFMDPGGGDPTLAAIL